MTDAMRFNKSVKGESKLMAIPAVVLLHAKDLQTWPWCRDGLLNNVQPSEIIVVCHRDLIPIIRGPHVSCIDEDAIIPGVTAQMFSEPRGGWYFQQVLKFGLAARLQSKYYLVVDSDVVFVRPVSFFSQGKPLYAPGSEYHTPYFVAYRELMGREAKREYSFIAHHMVFRSEIVLELLSSFQAPELWWKSIANFITPRPPLYSAAQFSEYETYGHFLKERHASEFGLRKLHWLAEAGCPTERKLKLIARRYDFASFHEHQRVPLSSRYDQMKRFAKLYMLPARNVEAVLDGPLAEQHRSVSMK